MLEETKNILIPSLTVAHRNEVCNIHNGPVSPCRGTSQCVIFQNRRALNTRHLGVTNGRRARGHVTRSPPIRGRLGCSSVSPEPGSASCYCNSSSRVQLSAPHTHTLLSRTGGFSFITRYSDMFYILQLPFDNMRLLRRV